MPVDLNVSADLSQNMFCFLLGFSVEQYTLHVEVDFLITRNKPAYETFPTEAGLKLELCKLLLVMLL